MKLIVVNMDTIDDPKAKAAVLADFGKTHVKPILPCEADFDDAKQIESAATVGKNIGIMEMRIPTSYVDTKSAKFKKEIKKRIAIKANYEKAVDFTKFEFDSYH